MHRGEVMLSVCTLIYETTQLISVISVIVCWANLILVRLGPVKLKYSR